MAGEIEIPLHIWPHRVNNTNAVWDTLTQTTNAHQSAGWRLRDAEVADLNAKLTRPIPSNINATPAGKVRLHWLTASSSTNSAKFFVKCIDVAYNTTSADPAAWDDELSVIDANNGAYVENECEVSIAAATLTAGRGLRLLIRRDATDVQDTLAADVIVTDVLFIADEA